MKYFLLALFILSPICGFSQKIVFDSTKDGGRFVATNDVRATGITEKVKQFYSIAGFQDATGQISYMLQLQTNWNSPYSIQKGMKLLLKNMNDEVLTLEAEATLDVNQPTYLPRATVPVYIGTASYAITKEVVDKISVGIKKVRIETTSDIVDKEFNSDKIGEFIAKGFELVGKALEAKRTDISEGF